MAEFCTCGAQLPPDALFCHKCGRAQREIVVSETVPQAAPEAVPLNVTPPPTALPLNFGNPLAVRIALLVAVSATVLFFVLPVLNWLVAGFFAVFFYRRRTGTRLNVGAGVRMGWITGIIMFPIFAIVFVANQIPAALSGRFTATIQEQLKTVPGQDPKVVEQMIHFLQTGPGVIAAFGFSLAGLFLFITGFSMAGGALGAKMIGRSSV
jgi:hypothetical protein